MTGTRTELPTGGAQIDWIALAPQRCAVETGCDPVYIQPVRRFDRYILREHNGPFWFALVVITLVLVIDFVPDVVSMVISKGLATSVIIQVFVLNLSWMLALSVPMAVLSGTLMAFGRLSSDSEILAMKASGVSLYRIIAPILLLSAVLGVALVEFNNEVLPDANHQARLLMSDIRRKRPTLDLKPNVMEDRIPGYHLLIKSMDQKTSAIAGVTIFDQKDQGAPRTVVAKTGVMNYSADGRTLILRLSDGEIHEVDPADPRKYRRTAFQQQVFYLGGVEDEWSRTSSDYRTDREKSSAQMKEDIAAWRQAIVPHHSEINRVCSTMVSALLLTAPATAVSDVSLPLADVTFQPSGDSAVIRQRALDRVRRVTSLIQREEAAVDSQERLINQYLIEIYKKYSIPAACVVFVLVGCPLGVLARRGGFGVGIGVSLGLFLVYWAFLIGGEELADREFISPFTAMWSADILIGGIGLVLLWSVTNEITLLPRAIKERLTSRRAGPPMRTQNGTPLVTQKVASP